jgi:hypothetical protein
MKQYIYFFKLNKSDQVLVEGMLEAFVSNLSMVSEGFYVFDVDHMLDLKPLIQDMMSETLSDICAYTSIPLKEKDVLTHLHTMKTLLKDFKGLKIGLLTNTDVIQCVSKDDVRLKPFILQKYHLKPYMIETIMTYLECNQHALKASKALYIHRNTLMMRLDNFYEATGFDVRTFLDGFHMYYVLKS